MLSLAQEWVDVSSDSCSLFPEDICLQWLLMVWHQLLLFVQLFLPHFSTFYQYASIQQPHSQLLQPWPSVAYPPMECFDDRYSDNSEVNSLPYDCGYIHWTRWRQLYCLNSDLLKFKMAYSNNWTNIWFSSVTSNNSGLLGLHGLVIWNPLYSSFQQNKCSAELKRK